MLEIRSSGFVRRSFVQYDLQAKSPERGPPPTECEDLHMQTKHAHMHELPKPALLPKVWTDRNLAYVICGGYGHEIECDMPALNYDPGYK